MNSPSSTVSGARQRRKTTRHHDRAAHSKENEESTSQPRKSAEEIASSKPESLVSISENQPENSSGRLSETARERRRTRLNRQSTALRGSLTTVDTIRTQPDLEDSTAGVAQLLHNKLLATEGDIEPSPTVNSSSENILNSGLHQSDQTQVLNHDRPLPELPRPATPPSQECKDILGITIHKTDPLKASINISHPCVRVTVVDTSLERMGELLKKSRPERCVTSFYERGNPNVDFILPVLTQPYRAVENSDTLEPCWDESLVFNELLTHFTENDKVLIFFELLDFSPVHTTSIRQKSVANSDVTTPWHSIAWGFLKPAGKVSKSMMGKRTRVQLYRFPKTRLKSKDSNKVFDLWLKQRRTTYPSTLYVTLKALPSDYEQELEPTSQFRGRSIIPTRPEVGTLTFDQLIHKDQSSKSVSSLVGQSLVLLSETARLPGQPCSIPTEQHITLTPTTHGCSSLKFSHNGKMLAVGCANSSGLHPVLVYKVPSFQTALLTEGHRGIIYDTCWNASDNYVATASGDGLVKIWSLESTSQEPAFTLPHPCYVYSVCFLNDSQLFTGAYDGNIRLWALPQTPTDPPQLLCELPSGHGLVNCLLWSEDTLYSGDSYGEVSVWHQDQIDSQWKRARRIKAFKGSSITSMSLHPNGRKLLLQSIRGSIVMMDLRIDRVCCEYQGLSKSQSPHSSSFISPCGGLVFATSLPGEAKVWNADNGEDSHTYGHKLPIKSLVSTMAYHPSEHMVVLSAYGSHEPIVVLVHKANKTLSDKPRVVSQLNGTSTLIEITKTLNRVTLS